MSPPAFVLRARSLSVDTGARVLFRDLDVTLTDSSRCGVVGPNGSGKSTLLRLLGGEQQPTAGTVALNPPTATIALVPQEPDRSRSETARRYLARRTHVAEATTELEAASVALAEGSRRADDRFDLALRRYERLGCADFDERTHETARRIGLDPVLLHRPTASLSGGEAARVSLAVVLLARADLLLLDEPTNDLDDEGLVLLDELVASTTSGIVVVSHDRVFLEQTVSSVVELTADGAFQFDGGWDAFVAEREARRRQAEEAWAGYDAERRRLTEIARRDRSWAQQGVHRAKTSGETDKFARFGAIQGAQNHGAKASVTQRALERLVPVDKPWEGWDLRLSIASVGRSGSVVARLEDVTVRRGDQDLGPWNVELRWGDRVALVGPNGSGKTTIVDVLAGRLEVTSGRRHLGPSVVVGELRQLRLEALSTGDVLGWFLDASELTTSQGRSLLAKFGLGADHLGRPPTSLSTGERTRAELALFQARGVNLLLLDEPTNHLDLDAIEQLEQALASYEGTLVVVSHDRRFLEHITFTRTVALGPAPLPRTASADQSAAAPSRRNPTASSTDPT